MEKIIKSVGEPRNYGPNSEQVEQEERRQAEIRLREQAAQQAEAERRDAEEAAQRNQRWEEWVRAECTARQISQTYFKTFH